MGIKSNDFRCAFLIFVMLFSPLSYAQEDLLRGVIEGVGRAILQEDSARRQEEERRRRELDRQRRMQEEQSRRDREQQSRSYPISDRESYSQPSRVTQGSRQQSSSPYSTTESRETISRIQDMLNRLGYNAGPVDGLMGSKTAGAIRAFQADHGIRQTGQPSASLVLSLQSELQNEIGSSERHLEDEAVRATPGALPESDHQESALANAGESETSIDNGDSANVTPMDSASDENIIIVNSGSRGSLPEEWRDDERRRQQREFLASMVVEEVLGTEFEQRFVDSQPLSIQEVFAAFSQAGIHVSNPDYLERWYSRGMVISPSESSMFNLRMMGFDLNQFEVDRLRAALREKALVAISRESRPSSVRVTLVCNIRVEDYDFDKEKFPFDQRGLEHCFSGTPNTIGNVRGYEVSVPINSELRPDGIPVDPSTAEQWVSRLDGPRFVLAIPATVTGRITRGDNNLPSLVYEARPSGALEIRSGQNLSEILYRYSDSELRDLADTSETRMLSNFDRAWWIDSPDEVEIVADRAEVKPLEALSLSELFDTETGLKFAFRVDYGDDLTSGSRSLSDFLDDNDESYLRVVSEALGLPMGNLMVTPLPLVGVRGGIDRVIVVLPQDAGSYTVNDQLPDYESRDGGRPFANAEIAVTAERIIHLPDGRERLLLAGHPERLVIRRRSQQVAWQNAPEIASVSFPREEVGEYEIIDLAWKSDLLWHGAQLVEQDPEEVIRQQLENSRFAGSDTFAKREAAQELSEAVRARVGDRDLHWMKARIKLDPYDFDRQGWRVASLSPELSANAPEADRALRVGLIADTPGRRVFIPMPPDSARAFQQASGSFPDFDALLAFRVSEVDMTYNLDANFDSGMSLRYEPIEMVLFAAGSGQTVINERAVLLRQTFSESDTDIAATPSASGSSAMASGTTGSEGFSILGVTLGANFESTVEALADSIGAEYRYYARIEARQRAAREARTQLINDWDAYHNGVLLESTTQSEMVAIYHEPPALADTVTAITRTRLFEPGTGPSWPQLQAQLLETYPQADLEVLENIEQRESVSLVLWPKQARHVPGTPVDPSAAACSRSLRASVGTSLSVFGRDQRARAAGNLRPADDRAIWVDEDGDLAIPRFASPHSLPAIFGGRGECLDFEVMAISATFGDDGRMLHFRQAISNPARMAAVADERRAQAESEAPAESNFDL